MLSQLGESIQILTKHTLTYLGDLQTHKIQIDDEVFSYLEGGVGPTLLLVHGAGGSKTQWRTVMQQLSQDYRVIAIDLPGFSMQHLGHPRFRSIRSMVVWLQRFVEGLQLDTFHFMAACSGAIVATSYALQHPARVQTITAIGLPDLQNRARLLELFQGSIIKTFDDVDVAMQRLFYLAPVLPGVVKRYYVQQIQSILPSFNERADELLNALPQLLPRLRSLTQPVHLISGEQDVFSGAASLEQLRSYVFGGHTEITLIPLCGHLPYLEKPELLVKHFLMFQSKL